MDSLTHALTGALIARTLPGRWAGEPADPLDPDAALTRPGRWPMPAAIVAALLPDAGTLAFPPPPLGNTAAYLLHRRGWSHSLLGVAAEAIAFAGLLWVLHRLTSPERKLRPTSAASRTSSRPVTGTCRTAGACAPGSSGGFFAGFTFARGCAVALLGTGSHLLLDAADSGGIRPFLPWDRTRYHGDLLFDADPWVWLMLGGALVCGTRRFGPAKWVWYALTAAATAAVGWACWKELSPWWVLAAWATGAVEVALLRRWGRWRAAAWVGWGMLGLYVGGVAGLVRTAEPEFPAGSLPSWSDKSRESVADLPVACVPWERVFVRRQTTTVLAGLPIHHHAYVGERLSLLPGLPARGGSVAVQTDWVSPRFAAVVGGTAEWRAWRASARFPAAYAYEEDGVNTLVLDDARWPMQAVRLRDASILRVPVGTAREWALSPGEIGDLFPQGADPLNPSEPAGFPEYGAGGAAEP